MGGTSLLQGYTALHLAADRGNIAAVELLLKHGADKTLKVSILPALRVAIYELPFFWLQKDTDGYTAADLATIAQRPDIVALLEHT
jgi:ankyrin repeat protein